MTVRQKMIDFVKEEEGLTAVEYAVAGGLVIGVLVTAFTELGGAACVRIGELITAIGGTPSGC